MAKTLAVAAYNRSQQSTVKTPFSVKKAQYITDYNKHHKHLKKAQSFEGPSSDHHYIEREDMKRKCTDKEFESLCYGKGKSDDITVTALWI